MKITRHTIRYCVTAVLCVIVYTLLTFLIPMILGKERFQSLFRPRVYSAFSPPEWKGGKQLDIIRYAQANMLVEHGYLRILTTKKEVNNFLGNPDEIVQEESRERWLYGVCYQHHAPARCWLFPGQFRNDGIWALEMVFERDKLVEYRFICVKDLSGRRRNSQLQPPRANGEP